MVILADPSLVEPPHECCLQVGPWTPLYLSPLELTQLSRWQPRPGTWQCPAAARNRGQNCFVHFTTPDTCCTQTQEGFRPEPGTTFDAYPNVEKISALVDLAKGTYSSFALQYAPFCSGQAHLPNGDIILCGGGAAYNRPDLVPGFNVSWDVPPCSMWVGMYLPA
jgi:hypothetical protein